MPAGSVVLFSANKDDFRISDIIAAAVKLALVSSAYTPNSAFNGHSVWADASANEIAAANGYSAGGVALSSLAKTGIAGGWKFSSADAAWNASGGSIAAWRYGVLYVSGTLWGMTNPMLGYFIGDSTPADVPATTAGNPLTISCPAGGWFDFT